MLGRALGKCVPRLQYCVCLCPVWTVRCWVLDCVAGCEVLVEECDYCRCIVRVRCSCNDDETSDLVPNSQDDSASDGGILTTRTPTGSERLCCSSAQARFAAWSFFFTFGKTSRNPDHSHADWL